MAFFSSALAIVQSESSNPPNRAPIHVTEEGVFVDITLMPEGEPHTARLGVPYAGAGFGAFCNVEPGDEVLVVCPADDPAEGLVIVARLYSASDPPPARARSHPKDVVLTVKDDQNLYLQVGGGGNVYLVVGDGKIKLSAEDGLDKAVLYDKLRQRIEGLENTYKGHTHPYVNVMAAAVTSPTTSAPSGSPDFASEKVELK